MNERVLFLLLFVLALLPRTLAPGDFITVDEAYHWFERTRLFLDALRAGDYAATNLIGHPGVTTLWLSSSGLLLHEAAASAGWLALDDPALARALLRLPLGIATALCIALAYPLLRRLLDKEAALLAALLCAADPFLIAHSKIVHVDALLTSFLLLALLAALLALRFDEAPPVSRSGLGVVNWPLLAAAALAGGLALLTKSPSIILLPMLGLITLVGLLRAGGVPGGWRSLRGWLRVGGQVALVLAVWLAGVLLVWAALWPAVWVDPGGAAWRMYIQVAYEGTVPHGWGNYFMGQAVDDPGPLFYPVALAFRLTPWALVGLLAAGVALLRRLAVPGKAALLLLLAFVLLFVLMLSLAAKKFDRYLLPIFPMLDILAAVGLVALWRGAQQRASAASSRLRQAARSGLPALLGLLLLANTLWYHPYYLAYYNPLLGGGALAARAIPIGWGEGLAEAGRYISAQLNGCDRPVASWFQPALEPFTCTPVVHLREAARPGRVDYVVQYIDQRQRENVPEISAMLRPLSPVHTVRIHGIDYAHIYQLPLPLAHATAAAFAPGIRLHSYELDSAALRSSGVLTLTTQWQAQVPLQQDYMLFVHVLDEQGTRVAQIDAPPGGPPAPTSAWNPGHYVTWYHPVPLPRDLPAGRYWVALGLYNAQDFARLPLQSPPPPPQAPDDGADALLLGPLLLP